MRCRPRTRRRRARRIHSSLSARTGTPVFNCEARKRLRILVYDLPSYLSYLGTPRRCRLMQATGTDVHERGLAASLSIRMSSDVEVLRTQSEGGGVPHGTDHLLLAPGPGFTPGLVAAPVGQRMAVSSRRVVAWSTEENVVGSWQFIYCLLQSFPVERVLDRVARHESSSRNIRPRKLSDMVRSDCETYRFVSGDSIITFFINFVNSLAIKNTPGWRKKKSTR